METCSNHHFYDSKEEHTSETKIKTEERMDLTGRLFFIFPSNVVLHCYRRDNPNRFLRWRIILVKIINDNH